MNRKFVLLGLLAFVTPSVAFGTQASFYLGGGIPSGTLDLSAVGGGKDDIGTVGPSFGGQLLYDFTKTVAAGIDLNYTKFGEKTSTKLSPLLDSSLNLKTTVITIVGKWTALPDQRVRPYLLGGLGIHNSNFKYEATPAARYVWDSAGTAEKRTMMDDTKTGFAGIFGIGLDLYINQSLFVGGEARFQYLGKVSYDTTSQGRALGVSSVDGDNSAANLFLKLGYQF